MVSPNRLNFPTEHPIGIGGVGKDQRHQHHRANQQERQAVVRRSGVPDRHRVGHDVGINADADAKEAEHE